jgi:hypothetical protein
LDGVQEGCQGCRLAAATARRSVGGERKARRDAAAASSAWLVMLLVTRGRVPVTSKARELIVVFLYARFRPALSSLIPQQARKMRAAFVKNSTANKICTTCTFRLRETVTHPQEPESGWESFCQILVQTGPIGLGLLWLVHLIFRRSELAQCWCIAKDAHTKRS